MGNTRKTKGPATGQQPQPARMPAPAPAAPKDNTVRNDRMAMAGLAIVTFICYAVCLKAQFTNWDDPGYIRDNPIIKSLDNIGAIFTTPVMGNYHPLTILSYALEYSMVQLQPFLYHLDSVVLHVITTLLVYRFVMLLTRKPVAAIVTALLFGVHTMHVESVAWLAGRKDVVYGSLYMGACITYLKYLRASAGQRAKWYGLTIFLFICSLLGKPVAVVLPLTLLLIDYFERRGIFGGGSANDEPAKTGVAGLFPIVKDKLPFLALAVLAGIRSLMDQHSFGALGTMKVSFNPLERIALGCHALVTYLWKAILPVDLSNFYPYPEKVNDALPVLYYANIAIVLALAFVVWKYARRNRYLMFGILFFIVNIALLLQFLPVGGAIVADRYAYIPYMGIFFVEGWLVAACFEEGALAKFRQAAIGVTALYAVVLGYLTIDRNQAWYDTNSLWRDEIAKHPRAPNAYNNLGFEYFNLFHDCVDPQARRLYFDSASYLLNKALELQPDFVNPIVSLGELYRTMGDYPKAKGYYYRSLAMNDTQGHANAYLGLAIIYAIGQKFDSSGYCFHKAVGLRPYFPEAHSNFGNYYDMMGKHDSSLAEYGLAISQNPDMYAPYLNRARELHRMNRCNEAMEDFERALERKPDMAEIYYSRSFCYTGRGRKREALADVEKARELGWTQVDPAYYQMLRSAR